MILLSRFSKALEGGENKILIIYSLRQQFIFHNAYKQKDRTVIRCKYIREKMLLVNGLLMNERRGEVKFTFSFFYILR